MTDEKGETWSPSGMSKVRSRPESLVADCSMHALQPPERRGRAMHVIRQNTQPQPDSEQLYRHKQVLGVRQNFSVRGVRGAQGPLM